MTRRDSSQAFVGRRAELDRLEDAFERAVRADPAFVLVAGDAGVGKSRLLAELADRVERRGGRMLLGGCLDLGEGGLPYAPFVEALRSFARSLDASERAAVFGPSAAVLARLVPDLGPSPDIESARDDGADPVGSQARLFDAVLGTLGRISRDGAVVLAIEDLQWADGSTRDLIRFLVRNMTSERVAIVATYRTDDLHRRHPLMGLLSELGRIGRVERIELTAFDRAEVEEQLGGILGRSPEPIEVDAMLERSSGLPFYVEVLAQAGGGTQLSIPPLLRDVLGARLAALSTDALTVVRAASVIGGRFPHERLAALVDLPPETLEGSVREAIEAHILVPVEMVDGPAYSFRHALLREAAYDELVPTERARAHARLVDHLDTLLRTGRGDDLTIVADLAVHAYHAHDLPRALQGSVRALHAFAAVHANQEALDHAQRALELWPRVGAADALTGLDHAALLAETARLASATGHSDRALEMALDALEVLEPVRDRDRRVQLLVDTFWYASEATRLELATTAAEEAYAIVRDAPPSRAKAVTIVTLGADRWFQGRIAESADLNQEAMAVADALGDRRTWSLAAASFAHCLADMGAAARAAGLVDRLETIGQDPDGTFEGLLAVFDRSETLWMAGRFEDSSAIAMTGLDHSTRYGWDVRTGWVFRNGLADCLLELGRYDEAASVTQPVLDNEAPAFAREWSLQDHVRIAAEQGRFEDAHRLAEQLTLGVGLDGWHWFAVAYLARADGRLDDAIDAVGHVPDLVIDQSGASSWLGLETGIGACADLAVLARRRRRSRDVARAEETAERWLDRLRAFVARAARDGGAGPFIEAILATAEAETGRLRGQPDSQAWVGVADRWSSLSQPYRMAYARLRLGEALLSSGRRLEAEGALGAALEGVREIGARPLVEAIEVVGRGARLGPALQVAPEEPESATEAHAGPASKTSLTGRERDVVRLVAAGHTNREIGDQLFISEKTVSVHVSNAMAKLGALSRYEAAAAAERQGLL